MKRRLLCGLAALTAVGAAAAQPAIAPITTTPLLPPFSQQQQTPGAPPPDQAPTPSTPQPMLQSWVPQGFAQLQVLDKVNAQNATLTVKVGQDAQFSSLNIQVRACEIRPPDQPQDSAAYLTITDSHADAPGFQGWMLANNPSLSMLQHPIYDVRVVACRT